MRCTTCRWPSRPDIACRALQQIGPSSAYSYTCLRRSIDSRKLHTLINASKSVLLRAMTNAIIDSNISRVADGGKLG